MPIFQYQARPSVPFRPALAATGWFSQFDQPAPAFGNRVPTHLAPAQAGLATVPAAAAAGISGMAWWRPFEQPSFGPVKAEQQPAQFSAALIPTTLPVGIAGSAWNRGWEPPFFPTRVRVELNQTEAVLLFANTLPPQTAGMAWYGEWEPPYFPTKVRTELQQTEFFVEPRFPFYFTGGWWKPFDQPAFGPVKIEQQPTENRAVLLASTVPPQIAGVAWWKPFDQPSFGPVKIEQQPIEERAVISPATLPVGISGSAWHRGWEPPFFPTSTKVHLQQTEARLTFLSSTLPVGVSGNAWLRDWEAPRFRSLPAERLQNTTSFLAMPPPVPLTGAWFKEFSQPPFSTSVKVTLQQTSFRVEFVPPEFRQDGGTSRYFKKGPFEGYELPDPALPKRKPFKPVWDRSGEVEALARQPAAPVGPPPLPPQSIFGQPPAQMTIGSSPFGLPTFDHLVPHDPGLGQRMQEAQDLSDAISVLKALGIIKDEE